MYQCFPTSLVGSQSNEMTISALSLAISLITPHNNRLCHSPRVANDNIWKCQRHLQPKVEL